MIRLTSLIFLFGYSIFLSNALSADPLTYCVPVNKINLNPFREIKDGKELSYLLLLMPYITSNTSSPSILSGYEFSPDGKIFKGRISPSALWPDKTSITPQEASIGIAKGFSYRPIGKRVWVTGCKGKNYERCSGIKILDPHTFEIHFDSKIKNLTGALREALTEGSRHNRVWPVKKNVGKLSNEVEVLGKNPIQLIKSGFVVDALGVPVHVLPRPSCKKVEFTLFAELLNDTSKKYIKSKYELIQAVTLQFNTGKVSLDQRSVIASWVRSAFKRFARQPEFELTHAFFLTGEPGFNAERTWNSQDTASKLRGHHLKLGVEIPLFRKTLERAAREDGISLSLYDFPLTTQLVDGQVLSSAITKGRQVILQDILKWNFASQFLENAPKTTQSLVTIADRSASTIPPDNVILQGFETMSAEEIALVPIGRRHVAALSHAEAPVRLEVTESGELTFLK